MESTNINSNPKLSNDTTKSYLVQLQCDITSLEPGFVICHQCNCVTWNAAGLAKILFEKYPMANTYYTKHQQGIQSQPGTIDISHDFKTSNYIINMYGQFSPGSIKKEEEEYRNREEYFKNCLKELKNFVIANHVKKVAFPYKIGCGLAGGNWNNYFQMLNSFAKEVNMEKVTVFLCKI
jgi:O-acetyl-ADP-ribose deacetylase (regulator of RNase III)